MYFIIVQILNVKEENTKKKCVPKKKDDEE
jgi:hypothetical protein